MPQSRATPGSAGWLCHSISMRRSPSKLLRENGGVGFAVSDERVFESQRMLLGRRESTVNRQGPRRSRSAHGPSGRKIADDETVVCLVTGHGFKDPDSIAVAAAHFRRA